MANYETLVRTHRSAQENFERLTENTASISA